MVPNDRLESVVLSPTAQTEPVVILGMYVPREDEQPSNSNERSHDSGEYGCRPDCSQCGCYPIS